MSSVRITNIQGSHADLLKDDAVYLRGEMIVVEKEDGTLDTKLGDGETAYSGLMFERERLINIIYPVGSVYMSLSDVEPSILFGVGTWERISGKFLLAASDDHAVGTTGGEEEHTLTIAETPSHTHTRGTMNIKGEFRSRPCTSGANIIDASSSTPGAFTCDFDSGANWMGLLNTTSTANGMPTDVTKFDASRSWTGATSAVGGSASHNNMPPYLAINMWQRIL